MSDSHRKTISVYGLGYVGCVSAVCLASLGHRVIGVDINPDKVESVGRGIAPIIEDRIGELTAQVVSSGALTVTTDAEFALLHSDVALICVGTPSGPTGELSTRYLEQVTAELGAALARTDTWHTLVYRSTMLPGTCGNLLIPKLEELSGKRAGVDFGVGVNPEYLREGTSVRDFFDPPKTVVGATDSRAEEEIMGLYASMPGDRHLCPLKVAEMTKYVDNCFHALKVSFANEIGSVCAALGLDSHAVMDIFLSDAKLNLGPSYLLPGFAFGGSCLPKDVRALTYVARRNDVDIPLIASILPSNHSHLERVLNLITNDDRRRVGIFGLAFKAGTDDLRESPMVELAERLIGKGYEVRIFDANVSMSRIVGANRAYVNQRLPHLSELLVEDPASIVETSEIIVVGESSESVVTAVSRCSPDHLIIDCVRLPGAENLRLRDNYRGVAW